MILPRIGLQQRVMPDYRRTFFDALAMECSNDLAVFAGEPRPDEMVEGKQALVHAHYYPAHNRHLLSGKAYLCWQGGFIKWLQSWQPQVLVVEANPRYLSTPAAIRWMHDRNRPVIGWGLGAPSAGSSSTFLRALWSRFVRQFDTLIAYSSQGAAEYLALGAEPQQVFIAPNAATPRPTHAPPQRPAQFDPDGALLLFVGRLQARKRVDLLLRACAGLPRDCQPRLWIVGDGPARAELESLAQSVYPAAKFWGPRHGAELEPLFASADLFVLPGTGGLAVQQAMSKALPVVVAEGDGTQADLVHPGNGWQVSPGDEAGLRAVLQDALSDIPRLRAMGLESFRIVRDEVNLEQMVQVFSRAVESVSR